MVNLIVEVPAILAIYVWDHSVFMGEGEQGAASISFDLNQMET